MRLNTTRIGPLTKYTILRPLAPARPGAVERTSEVNVYRLGDTLFDAGSAPGGPLLVDALRGEDLSLRRIVFSHQHEDHIGGLGALLRAFADSVAQVFAPAEHMALIRDGFPVPDYRAAHWGDAPAPIATDLATAKNLEWLQLADETLLSGFPADWTARTIPIPGHTVGQKAFLISSKSTAEVFVLSADLYLAPRLQNALYESSIPDMIASLERLLDIDGEFTLCPSHGGPFANGRERVQKLRDWYLRERDAILAARDRLQLTAEQCR